MPSPKFCDFWLSPCLTHLLFTQASLRPCFASPGRRHVCAHTVQPGKACMLRNDCPGSQSWHAGFEMKRWHSCSSEMGRYWACPQRSHAPCRVSCKEKCGSWRTGLYSPRGQWKTFNYSNGVARTLCSCAVWFTKPVEQKKRCTIPLQNIKTSSELHKKVVNLFCTLQEHWFSVGCVLMIKHLVLSLDIFTSKKI